MQRASDRGHSFWKMALLVGWIPVLALRKAARPAPVHGAPGQTVLSLRACAGA